MMEIYFAEPQISVFKKFYELTKIRVNVLFSYYYEHGHVQETMQSIRPYVNKIMLDSGGFSSSHLPESEKNKTRDGFLNFIEQYGEYLDDRFTCTFAFDDLSKGKNFYDNLNLFDEQVGKYPRIVPIVHNIMPDSTEIEEYAKYSPHTIAIGKCDNKTSLKYLRPAVDKIKTYCRCHLLGITDFKIITSVNADSCDSTSWMHDAKDGIVRYFKYANGTPQMELIYFPDKQGKTRNGTVLLDDFSGKEDFLVTMLKSLNLKRADFYNNNYLESRQLANIFYTVELNNYLRQKNALGVVTPAKNETGFVLSPPTADPPGQETIQHTEK
ncbi:hypothetical protein [Desulfovibrio desulfuricans]|uniref:hypothetical protein n=1 Tax=Desulfovibrio desulfuricans TaxID=876 RepID=UPI001AEA839B|nr:hypothetical protein [Desulfovibrio desulfuricans]QTO40856.1 hypothetical protein J8J02_02745 [Desulfovibrio desulfuricans]